MSAIAVIGAAFGDEGKGNAVSYLARKFARDGPTPLVARGNGGCQAGHTVVDGPNRHVFGHVGAGTFAGAGTYLAQDVILNPPILQRELGVLAQIGFKPAVRAHWGCRVSTPYDIALNSLAELARGADRHGSCGYGINETVERNQQGFRLDLGTVRRSSAFEVAQILGRIREEWVPARMRQHGLAAGTFGDDALVRMHLAMLDVDPRTAAGALRSASFLLNADDDPSGVVGRSLIVEGAQGLGLDEHLGDFPHVTRSITGLPAAIRAAAECGETDLQPVYVTRTYTTRHGPGPLDCEGLWISDRPLVDATNATNRWQGALRYAPLNLCLLDRLIRLDLERSTGVSQLFGVTVRSPKLFLTCMDQLGEVVNVVDIDGMLVSTPRDGLLTLIERELGIQVGWTSHGPTADDVREH